MGEKRESNKSSYLFRFKWKIWLAAIYSILSSLFCVSVCSCGLLKATGLPRAHHLHIWLICESKNQWVWIRSNTAKKSLFFFIWFLLQHFVCNLLVCSSPLNHISLFFSLFRGSLGIRLVVGIFVKRTKQWKNVFFFKYSSICPIFFSTFSLSLIKLKQLEAILALKWWVFVVVDRCACI